MGEFEEDEGDKVRSENFAFGVSGVVRIIIAKVLLADLIA